MRKGWKRVHRLVVLPDYQGIGIGLKFINEVTKFYIENGFNMNLTTTTPALVYALAKDPNWALIRANRTSNNMKKNFNNHYNINVGTDKTRSDKRITFSFNWKILVNAK